MENLSPRIHVSTAGRKGYDFSKINQFYIPVYLWFTKSMNLLLISSCFKEINCIFAIHKIRHKTELK